MRITKLINVFMVLGLFAFAGCSHADYRHNQFDNIYSKPLTDQQVDDIKLFVFQQGQELQDVLRKNLSDKKVEVNVVVGQIMMVDTGDFGSVSFNVFMNEKEVVVVNVAIFKDQAGWTVSSVKTHDMVPDLKAFIGSLPPQN